MAVPFDVAYATVISLPEAAERLTVNVAFPAVSFVVVTSLIESEGALSSSVIVMVEVESLIVALTALLKVSVIVSLFSSALSAKIGTLIVLEVCPAVNVSVPLVEV